MKENFSVLLELKHIHEMKKRMAERERKLSTPKLKDMTHVPLIYEWFCELAGGKDSTGAGLRTELRQQFVFIVLYLYSPATLVGRKISRGLRGILAKTLGFKSPTGVSNLCRDSVFFYDHYKTYRESVDYLYSGIINRLRGCDFLSD